MTSTPRHVHRSTALRALLLSAACLGAGPSFALYKVVGPDGKVTYTDRPPSAAEGRASPINARTGAAESAGALPAELRQAISRYPVTLYTIANGCEPCVEARDLLRKRGVPFSERQVVTGEDSEAFQKITGGRDAPVLAIGAQQLKGLAPQTWNGYLDAAGYPRESKLPPGYVFASPQPLTERPAAVAPSAAATPAPAPVAETPAPAPGSIRF
jgi:glutaredoxin